MRLDQEEAARDEIEHLSEFFDLEIDTPNFETTLTVPRVQGDSYSELKINPYVPWGGAHESRHVVHREVIDDLAETNQDEMLDFYEGELEGLESSLSYYSAVVSIASSLTGEKTSDELYEELLEGEDHEVSDLVFSKNAETDLQPEVFAHNSQREVAALFGGGAVPWFLNAAYNMEGLDSVKEISPEAGILIGGSLALGYLFTRDVYGLAGSDPLTEERLRDYDGNDRKRAMLYNSQVEKDLDHFLEILDSYGVE